MQQNLSVESLTKLQYRLLTNIAKDYDLIVGKRLDQIKDEMLTNGTIPRKCRFCGQSEPSVHFNKRAHAISELCGNHHLLSDYECDICNAKFSKYERQFSQFMLFYHSVLGVDGKKGIPTFQPDRNGNSNIKNENGKPSINVQVNEKPIAKLDAKNNSIMVSGSRTYVPIDVYRALLKMALTMMPESEMQYLSDALSFIMDENFTLATAKSVHMRIYTGGFNVVRPASIQIYKRKAASSSPVPAYIFTLAYSNFAFQMYLPGCSLDNKLKGLSKIDVPIVPTIVDGVFPSNGSFVDLKSTQKVTKEPLSLTFTFERLEAQWLVPWYMRLRYYCEKMWYDAKRKIKKWIKGH